jgi:seryl-tRNA synthetase
MMTSQINVKQPACEHVLLLEEPLSAALAGEFAKRIFFAAEEIRDFRLIRDGDQVTAVAVIHDGPDVPDGLSRKLRYILLNDVMPQLVRDPKVVWRSPVHRNVRGGTFDELVNRGIAYPTGEGQVALTEPVLSLMDQLDRLIRRIAVDVFAAKDVRYPTLLPIGALNRCNYLASFPQHAMFATRFRADLDTYRQVLSITQHSSESKKRILRLCNGVDYSLPPTMCYHTFNQLSGQQLPPELSAVTARGKSFRHEARYYRTLARLWDFTIREIVFLGSRPDVLAAREGFLRRAWDLATELGLSGRSEVANDPFFCRSDSGVQSSSQRLLELKYELQLDVGPGESVAVASFNFHDRFFGESFDISLADGGPSFSSCVGFGLERFAFAVICQHGLDPADWPDILRDKTSSAQKEVRS